jgi:hypothetical protein
MKECEVNSLEALEGMKEQLVMAKRMKSSTQRV